MAEQRQFRAQSPWEGRDDFSLVPEPSIALFDLSHRCAGPEIASPIGIPDDFVLVTRGMIASSTRAMSFGELKSGLASPSIRALQLLLSSTIVPVNCSPELVKLIDGQRPTRRKTAGLPFNGGRAS